MIIPLCMYLLSLLYLVFNKKPLRNRIISSAFIFLFSSLYFLGGIIAELVIIKIPEFKGIKEEGLIKVYYIAIISLFFFVLGTKVTLLKTKRILKSFKQIKQFHCMSFLLAFGSITVYIVINGLVLFKTGGYINRYETNVGLGLVTALFPFGLLFLNYHYFLTRRKWIVFVLAVFYAIIVFIVKGGQRQIGFAAIFNYFMLLYIDKRIKLMQIIFLSILGLLFINFVALFRYYDNIMDVGIEKMIPLIGIYIFDGIIPIDAFYNIVEYVDRAGPPGVGIVFNQFSTLVPRMIWNSKPLVVLNAGNFYTKEILNIKDFITYSPTFLGELYLIGGVVVCIIGSFSSGLILRSFDDEIKEKRGSRMIIIISLSFLLLFNLYREGLFVFLTFIISFSLFLVPVVFFNSMLQYSTRTKI